MRPATSGDLSQVHSWLFYVLLAAIVVHVAAVAAYAVVKGQDLVRPMVSGKKLLPAATRAPRMAPLALALLILAVVAAAVAVAGNPGLTVALLEGRHRPDLAVSPGAEETGSWSAAEQGTSGMPQVRSVAVFCGARPGIGPAFARAAAALGEGLARAGIRLVYGGGRVGLMGALADACLAAGGQVIGVIPEFLTRSEVAHPYADQMIVTDSMHSRKRRMFELADAFVSFAGGLGTLDETFEILTWRQLGLHDKPILICDLDGSAEPLLNLIEATIADRFCAAGSARLVRRRVWRAGPAGGDRCHRAGSAGRCRAVLKPLVLSCPRRSARLCPAAPECSSAW